MRQHLLYAFAASLLRDHIRWAPAHVLFKVQDKGAVTKISDPVDLDVLFDRAVLDRHVDRASIGEFFQECNDILQFEQRICRCGPGGNMTRGFEPWLDLYEVGPRPFSFAPSVRLNGTETWPELQRAILSVSSCSNKSGFLAKGLPELMWDPWTVDVMAAPTRIHRHLLTEPMPRTPFGAFLDEALHFQPAVRAAADLIQTRLQLSGSQGWVALHVRDGYIYRKYFGQKSVAQLGNVTRALHLVESPQRCGVDTSRILLSTINVDAKKQWVHHLQQGGRRTVSWFNQSIWDMVYSSVPGWHGKDHYGAGAILEMLVEMELWKRAPAFVGTRSTMSEFVFLWRGASGLDKARCTFSAQPDWKKTK